MVYGILHQSTRVHFVSFASFLIRGRSYGFGVIGGDTSDPSGWVASCMHGFRGSAGAYPGSFLLRLYSSRPAFLRCGVQQKAFASFFRSRLLPTL